MLYISGPMSGIPDHNFPAFRRAALRLRRAGYDVVSPHETPLPCGCVVLPPQCGADDHTWAEFLRKDLLLMMQAVDRVALLPGWENSRGARLEVDVAARLGMAVKPIDEWLDLAKV